jgi:hypothetical protein
MSRLTLFVVLSILINVGSLVAYLRNQSDAQPAAVTAPAPATVESTTPLPLDQPIWNALQPEPSTKALPSASFIAQLRSAGFPTDIIRVIVRQQIEDHYAPREAAIAAAHDTTNYWETKYGTNASYRESGPERIAVRLEKNALMRQLLGDDAETPRERARRARDYGNIPIETVDRLTTLRTEFDHLEIELRERAQGTMLPSDPPSSLPQNSPPTNCTPATPPTTSATSFGGSNRANPSSSTSTSPNSNLINNFPELPMPPRRPKNARRGTPPASPPKLSSKPTSPPH